jgi:hypothetical protein
MRAYSFLWLLLPAIAATEQSSVAYLGTRVDLSGNADDDLVATVGYRYLFD